jgi:hypothetical protein
MPFVCEVSHELMSALKEVAPSNAAAFNQKKEENNKTRD